MNNFTKISFYKLQFKLIIESTDNLLYFSIQLIVIMYKYIEY